VSFSSHAHLVSSEDAAAYFDVMRIGIDFDSTIAKIDQPWLDRLNAIRGTSYRAENWSDWELTFLDATDKSLLFSLFTPDLYENVMPYFGAPEAIRRIALEPDVTLVCVTSNPREQSGAFTAAKQQWLRKFIPELGESIIAAREKSGLGLDVLIDDAPHHHENTDYVPVLIKRPWNRAVPCPLQFEDWLDGQELLLKLIREQRHDRSHDQRSVPAK
jgi:5'(3')-deoxyribonucleotidase